MRSILMIVTALFLIGCSKSDKGEGNSTSTTQMEGSSILLPPSEELKAQGYNDKYVKVANTERPDYNAYRKQWKRVNKDVLHEGYELVDNTIVDNTTKEPVIMDLDDLHFNHAFHMQYCAKGEGHTFWWRGNEYTTNLLNNEINDDSDYPSVDEEE